MKVGPFITHRYTSLDEVPAAFAGAAQAPDYVKGVVELQPDDPINPESSRPDAMRLITSSRKPPPMSAPRVGALLPGDSPVLDFAVGVDASGRVPLGSWFDLDDYCLPHARRIHDASGDDVLAGASRRWRAGSVVPLADIRLLAPVPRPGKLICIGLNYKDHAAESKMPRAGVAGHLLEVRRPSVTHPAAPVYLPAVSQQVDYEAELAVVIGRRAKHVPRERAYRLRARLHEPQRRQRARPAVRRQAVAARQVVRHASRRWDRRS